MVLKMEKRNECLYELCMFSLIMLGLFVLIQECELIIGGLLIVFGGYVGGYLDGKKKK